MKVLLLPIALLASVVFAAAIPPSGENIKPGMERGVWALEPWGNSGAAEKETLNGRKLLKLIYEPGEKGKTGFKHLTGCGINEEGKIAFMVYAPTDTPPKVGLAISTTPAYTWHESETKSIKKGWNRIEFSVRAKNWKTQASEWKHSVTIDSRDDVRAVDLLIYNEGKQTGVLFFEGLQYDLDPRGEQIAALISDLQSEDIDIRSKAEKDLIEIGRPALEALHQIADDDRPEVLLRAAAALKAIEGKAEEMPTDPKIRAELEKQKDAQKFEEARRRSEYTLRGMDNERLKLLALMKEAEQEVVRGKTQLEELKHIDDAMRKTYQDNLAKLEKTLTELKPLFGIGGEQKK